MMMTPTLALLLCLAGGQAEVVLAETNNVTETVITGPDNVTEAVITGPDNVEVGAGEEAILVCEVEQPYKFCKFINPAGKTFILDPHVQHEEGRISYAGSEEEVKTSCGVKMSPVVEADDGVWRCEVTVMVEGKPQVGRSRAIVTVLLENSSGLSGKMGRIEEKGGGRMEAGANATAASQLENHGDRVGEVEEPHGQTKATDRENEETQIVPSTTDLPEADGDYLKENLHGVKDKNQSTSAAPQVENEINPSAGNSDKYLKEEVSKFPPVVEGAQEEDRKDETTDLTEEQVAVVTIICLMIVAIIFTAIAKIKKLLCFRVTSTEDAEDAEKSTLRMYSMEKSSKSSLKSGDMTNDGVKEGNYP